jgi:hypothetical protein
MISQIDLRAMFPAGSSLAHRRRNLGPMQRANYFLSALQFRAEPQLVQIERAKL